MTKGVRVPIIKEERIDMEELHEAYLKDLKINNNEESLRKNKPYI